MLTVYDWMLLNVDKLVDAVAKDGKLCGPTSEPLLDEAQTCDQKGKLRHQARCLLKRKLTERGLGHLL